MPEIVDFLKRSQLVSSTDIGIMTETLLSGLGMPSLMKRLGFSDTVVTQLSLAEIHGNSQRSLLKIEAYLRQVRKIKKKLVEVTTYPLILLGFLVLIVIGGSTSYLN